MTNTSEQTRKYEAIIRWETSIPTNPLEWGLSEGDDVAATHLSWLRGEDTEPEDGDTAEPLPRDYSYLFEGLESNDILVHDITTRSTAARIVAALNAQGWLIPPNNETVIAFIEQAINDQT